MDAIENARQIAAVLHREAVEKNHDPTHPYTFAILEAERRGIIVEHTKPGAAILDGGRAKFIRNEQLILHERCDSEFEQAFLVAHELGHVALGDDVETEPAIHVDLTRPSEPSPIGEERVVDYGKRQRREVQMDLFAREFLLPRATVGRLHVEGQLSASDIADRFKAPFDVVAQQLFDALLLPSVGPSSDIQAEERLLNKRQSEAASHRGNAMLLEAGPGTGKTQTLTSRVEGLLSEGVDPRRILLLTFSNKAAAEMADRIAKKNKDASVAMWIGTFHAFGLDLVRRFYGEIGLERDPRLIDRTEAVELLEEEFPRFEFKHYHNVFDPTQNIIDILSAISRAKDEVVDAARYRQLAEAMHVQSLAENNKSRVEQAEKCLEIATVYETYERLKTAKRCIDFGDLVSIPVRLLEGHDSICSTVASQYEHVLVDEYQDVNRCSVRLLKALCPDGRDLWVVGDAKQSIYRFRGASSFNTQRFGTEDFSSGTRKRLKDNYRSVEEVVEAFSLFAKGMAAGDDESDLRATRGSGGNPLEIRTVEQADLQTLAIADAIAEMRKHGNAFKDQAILCTGNERIAKLGSELERLGIPVLFLGSLFERPEIKDLLAFLSLLTDRRAIGLVRIGCHEETQLSLQDVAAVIDQLRGDELEPGHWLQSIQGLEGVSPEGRVSLDKIAEILQGFDQANSPWEILATLLVDRTRTVSDLATNDSVASRSRGVAIWQFMNFIRVQPEGQGLPVPRLLDRIRRLMRLGDDKDLRSLPEAANGLDGVRLMTIHGAKGLEFPVIHLPGMNKNTLPRASRAPACLPPDGMIEGAKGDAKNVFSAGHDEEQECLFYVALSRARDRIIVYAPTKMAGGRNWALSPFLDRLGTTIVRSRVEPEKRGKDPENEDVIPINVEGGLRFSAAQIGLYASCPRRFFYTHMLNTGGRRQSSAFMKMHNAVREICEASVADGITTIDDVQIQSLIVDSFKTHGLRDHGYEVELARIALRLVRFFLSTRQVGTVAEVIDLEVSFADDCITFRPDDHIVDADGTSILRRLRTGGSKQKKDDIAAAALVLATAEHSPHSKVELLHLSDRDITQVDLTPRVLKNRTETLLGSLKGIRGGRFPANPVSRICPGCPAFFICGPVPEGEFKKTS